MIEYNEAEQRMVLKLVFYGPALSGKTTNLLRLHDILQQEGRGELMVLDTTDDRTIFFDLLPFFLVAPSGLKIKIKVYTVPGQVKHDATRKAVLQRADGIAFIADSQIREQANNGNSFSNLEQNLSLVGIDLDGLPLVIQFNKRDLPEIVPEDDLRAIWGPTGLPLFFASALSGTGVLETFATLAGLVYDRINLQHALTSQHGMTREGFVAQLTRQGAS